MRILSNALKKEQGSKGSDEYEEEKNPSLSLPNLDSQKPRQNFEQKIQAIRKLQREDPNIYKEWSLSGAELNQFVRATYLLQAEGE